jgi:hypothetical protein
MKRRDKSQRFHRRTVSRSCRETSSRDATYSTSQHDLAKEMKTAPRGFLHPELMATQFMYLAKLGLCPLPHE